MFKSYSEAHIISNRIFQILVPLESPHEHSIELQGRYWTLINSLLTHNDVDTPEYVCVSYVWGKEKIVNPFNKDWLMSSRTIPVLNAIIKTWQPKAIWIDALCVPFQDPERTACLQNMGMIYSKASRVIVVLSESCSTLLEQIQNTGYVDIVTLLTLEDDDWVTRVWTYQEVVNSKSIHFIVEKGSNVSVPGDQLLNCVGQAISKYKQTQGYDTFALRILHPRLDSLEDLIADWLTANYLERSAYQVMSDMARRVSERPDDHFYAMIGAINTISLDAKDTQPVHPAEYFMRVCEEKADYSFIYSAAPRSEIPGKCWRPIVGLIPAILPWHSYGEGQSGCIYPTHIKLDNMCHMMIESINPTAKQFVEEWLKSDNVCFSSETIINVILQRLKNAGFSGCGQSLELQGGYFFPLTPIGNLDDVFAVISTGVRWVHGSPGLLVRKTTIEIHHYCDVGVFVGIVPQEGNPINIGK